ncbi:MAG: hypothetical protein WD067_11560 [Gaiellaceae bacterium]
MTAARAAAVTAAALALAVDAYYAQLIFSDPAHELLTPVPLAFAGAILAAAALLLVAATRPRATAAAAVVLAACAVVSGFSIGLFLVPSVMLALIASVRA